MIGKAAPRPPAGTQRADDRTRLIGELAGGAAFVDQVVVLAALLYAPALAGDYVRLLDPADWESRLHQQIARMARAELLSYGRVDRRGLSLRLLDGGLGSHGLDLLLRSLERVAGLLDEAIVAEAVAAMTAHRRGAVT